MNLIPVDSSLKFKLSYGTLRLNSYYFIILGLYKILTTAQFQSEAGRVR